MDRLAFLERLREAALAWDRSDESVELLWRGELVKEAGLQCALAAHELTTRERAFVDESRRRERRRTFARVGAAAGAALLVVAAVLAKRAMDRDQ